jgi:HSP20 family protein
METLVKRNGFVPSMNTIIDDFFSKDLFDWADKNFAALGTNTKQKYNIYQF